MSKSNLITQNLVEAVKWFLSAPDSVIKDGDGAQTWKQKAQIDLINSVQRNKTDFPEAARRGMEFEKKIYTSVMIKSQYGSEFFKEVCQAVDGFEFGKKKGINLEIDGETCYLYGKFDAIKSDKIIDIKTTGNYKKDKYLQSFQHPLYCYITGIKDFEYIIVEWDEYPKIKAVHREIYQAPEKDILEKEVIREIQECFEVLKMAGLWEDYKEKYCLY